MTILSRSECMIFVIFISNKREGEEKNGKAGRMLPLLHMRGLRPSPWKL